MNATYVPLKEICAMTLDEVGKSVKDMDKAWILAFRALNVLEQSFAAEPKSVRLPVLPNKTVPIPFDCKSITKIGLINQHGELVSLKIDNGLVIFRDNNPNRLQDIFPNISDGIGGLLTAPIYFNYYDNGSYYNLFGVGGGLIQYGSCRIDEKNNVIVLSPEFRYDSIILEYISSPEQDDDYKVPSCLREAIISFIKWKMKLADRQEFYNAAIEGRRSLPNKRVTLQQVNQVIRASTGQYLKS